jgi:hypothetical protein
VMCHTGASALKQIGICGIISTMVWALCHTKLKRDSWCSPLAAHNSAVDHLPKHLDCPSSWHSIPVQKILGNVDATVTSCLCSLRKAQHSEAKQCWQHMPTCCARILRPASLSWEDCAMLTLMSAREW